jgi:hypothetical protein
LCVLGEEKMKKILFLFCVLLLVASCVSDEGLLNDEDGFGNEWGDEDNNQLPVNDDENEEKSDDSDDLPVSDENDVPDDTEVPDEVEAVDDEQKTEPDEDPDDEEIEDDTPDETEDPDEEEPFYAEICDCYGVDYDIPAGYREIKDWCYMDDSGDGIPNCIELDSGTFYVELPYNADEDEEELLNFKTNVERADIMILVDLSGSMAGEIDNLKQDITDVIINDIGFTINDAGFGLATFDDWKAVGDDTIYQLIQPITTDMTVVANAVNGLDRVSWCGWEPHSEALYQVASGAGYSGHFTFTQRPGSTNACDISGVYYPDIPAVNCYGEEGNIGGACFRRDAMPIVIMLSDENFHDFPGNYSDMIEWHIDYNTKQQAIDALNSINAKFIGIDSWHDGMTWTGSPENDFKEISIATGSVDVTTGAPFFYKIDADGTGLSEDIVDAVLKLTSNIKLDVWTEKEGIDNPYGIDSSLFIKALLAVSSNPPEAYDSKDSEKFYQVYPGATVNFQMLFHNSVYEPVGPETTVFRAKISVLGDGFLLDSRNVVILVPGSE